MYFDKKSIVTITPVLSSDCTDVQTELDPIILQGEDVQANNKVIGYESGGSFTHSVTADFQDEFRLADLSVNMLGERDDEQMELLTGEKLADGVVATSELVQMDPKVIMLSDNFERIKPYIQRADIHYVIQRAYVRNSELRKEDIQKLQDFIEMALESEDYEIKGGEVSAYASPDGPWDLNKGLAEDRLESGKRVMEREFKGSEKAQEEGFYQTETTTEDWEGFKELVQESDIRDKELILRVLSMYDDPQVREQELRKMSKAFIALAEDILPKLRRSVLTVNSDQIGFSDEELADFIFSNPDTLNVEEKLYAATLFDNNDQKLQAYQQAAESHPECLRAQNNIGYIQYQNGNMDEAQSAFEAARRIKSHPVVLNNLGAMALKNGNIEDAQNLLSEATDAGEEVNYNLGIVAIKNAEYESAVNYLNSFNSVNTALAMTLAGNNNAAMNTLNQIESPDAIAFYLKAVVAAKMDNSNEVFDNLRTAIQKNPDLKEMARTDVLFSEYSENATFTSIIE